MFPGGSVPRAARQRPRAGVGTEQFAPCARVCPSPYGRVTLVDLRADDPGSLVRALGDIVAKRLEDSGYQGGCSIATMVLELAPQDEELAVEFDAVFARWRAALVDQFEQMGVAPERAAVLAELVMSAIEGALVLSRAARSLEPFRSTVNALSAIIDHEVAPRSAAEPSRRRPARRQRGVERAPRSR